MTPQQIVEAARDVVAGRPELEAEMRAGWAVCLQLITDRAKQWDARIAFLQAILDGCNVDECARRSLMAAGLLTEGKR